MSIGIDKEDLLIAVVVAVEIAHRHRGDEGLVAHGALNGIVIVLDKRDGVEFPCPAGGEVNDLAAHKDVFRIDVAVKRHAGKAQGRAAVLTAGAAGKPAGGGDGMEPGHAVIRAGGGKAAVRAGIEDSDVPGLAVQRIGCIRIGGVGFRSNSVPGATDDDLVGAVAVHVASVQTHGGHGLIASPAAADAVIHGHKNGLTAAVCHRTGSCAAIGHPHHGEIVFAVEVLVCIRGRVEEGDCHQIILAVAVEVAGGQIAAKLVALIPCIGHILSVVLVDVAPVEQVFAVGFLRHAQACFAHIAVDLIEAVVVHRVGSDKGHYGLLAVAVIVAGGDGKIVARPPVFRVAALDPACRARKFIVGIHVAGVRVLNVENDFVGTGVKADVSNMVLAARAGGVKGDGLHKGQCSEAVVVVLILAEAAVYAVLSKGAGDRVAFAVPAVVPQKRVVVTVAVDAVDAQLGHLVHQEWLVNRIAVGVFRAVGVKLRRLPHVEDAVELG